MSIYGRVKYVLEDLTAVLGYSIEKDNHKAFDDLLSSAKIEELNLMMKEKQYLIEVDKLKEKIIKLKDKINFVFKEIDGAGLSNDYNGQLDDT